METCSCQHNRWQGVPSPILVGHNAPADLIHEQYWSFFTSCDDKVYKAFPLGWSGRCGLGFLTPSVTRYSTLNVSQITNLGSFVLKAVPRKHTRRGVIENWRVSHNAKFFSVLRSLFSSFGTYQPQKAVWNPSREIEQELSIAMQTSEALQSEVNS